MTDDDGHTAITIVTDHDLLHKESEDSSPGLVVLYGKNIGAHTELLSPKTMIGRSATADIVIEGDGVSRQHARVIKSGKSYIIEDLNSTNGTFVNDIQVKQHPLTNGDQIKIGSTVLKYVSSATIEANFHEEIYRLTTIDGLTQILNKRCFLENLELEVNRFKRYGSNLTLALFDIDHFKQINDTYGHLAGDQILRDLASLVGGLLRKNDLFARYGGEEFAIIFPETSADKAKAACEKLRLAVEKHDFIFENKTIDVTISIGLSSHTEASELGNPSQLIALADKQLYVAKESGRNCVCL